jgi:signal peptidase II
MNERVRSEKSRHATAIAVAAAVAVADQATKAGVTRLLGPDGEDRAFAWFGDGLVIEYVQNRGAAFGVLGDLGPVLTVLAVMVLAALLVYYHRAAVKSPWLVGAVGLIAGGAVGNLIDRLWLGYVVDFITVGPWPTFNLADSAITVGVGLLAVSFLRDEPAATPRREAALGVQSVRGASAEQWSADG